MAADTIRQYVEEIKNSADRSFAYSNLLQIHRLSANDPSSMQSLANYSPSLIPIILSDIHTEDEEIAAQALKCLGFMIYHPSLVPIFSEEAAGMILDSLGKLIMETRMKAICNLGVWCLSIQQLGDAVVVSRMELLTRAAVHAMDNPFGSLSTTFEAIQAITKMATHFPEKMRDTINIWIPPIYRRLVSNNKKERDMAERCLLKTTSILHPHPLTLSKPVALDLKKSLLQCWLGMSNDLQQKLPMIHAWGWYIFLLGSSLLKNRHLLNEMLKIPEQTFTYADPQIQIASLVAWERLIGALLPAEKMELEMDCSDKITGLLKRINVLIMPLKGILSSRCDVSVHSSCLKTWHFLLHKLDVSVNHPLVITTSFWPVLEAIFSRRLDSMHSTSLWTSCLDLLDDYILSKARSGYLNQSEESPTHVIDKAIGAGSFVNNKASFKEYPIKWIPWEICNLDRFLKIISLVLEQSLDTTVTSEKRKLAFNYCFRIFRSVLWGVEVEFKMPSANYARIQFCITTILTFLKVVSEDMASKYCDKQHIDFLLPTFKFLEAIREVLDSSVFASSLYRGSLDLKYIKEIQLSDDAENVVVQALEVSPLVYKDMVSPIVYTTILDLCFMAQSVPHLLMSETEDLLCSVKHIKLLLFSANHLLNLHAAISFLYMHMEKPINMSFCLLTIWRIIGKAFMEIIHNGGQSFLNSEFDNAPSFMTFQFLCYPFVMLLYSPKVSVHKSASNDSDICRVSSEREIELDVVFETWKSLFDSLSNGSQNKLLSMNNCAEGLSQLLIRVLEGSIYIEIQGNPQSVSGNYQKIGFHLAFGELVICILTHAQVLHAGSSGSVVINQESVSQNQGSPITNCLGLVARFMKLSVKFLKTNPTSNMIICRVFAALIRLVGHICLKPDVLLLMELLSDPLVQWLSWCTPMSGEMHQKSGIVYQLQCLWTEILSCIRRSQPVIIFDSHFLEAQASLLQASLDHFHSPISEAAIAYWNDMYSQNAGLNYPQCLLPILDKLSRSGRINLQQENQLAFANNTLTRKRAAVLSEKRMSRRDTSEGHHPPQGVDHLLTPGFRIKRSKITNHPNNLNGIGSIPAKDTGVFNFREGRIEHSKANYVLERLKRP